ncbi:hypothetical protein THAR02_00478 [Trichoderma harzianum]|uniref:Uncharacterized protein n=1 Tax=Trichoderma harzianum TaxID=5544 RepID=A0A0F9XRT6_TRIHA|nr:hypothetical protein THAR02_00478 [Trichoderma harzianum]
MPQARVSGGARPTRRAAAGDRERDNGGGFDGDADASAARLGGCSTEAKARQRLNCPDKGQGQQQNRRRWLGRLSSARGCSRWSLGSRTRRFLSRAVANRLSATGGRIAAGRDAAMDWMFVEGRDADAHEMVFGDRYQEERPAATRTQCYLKLLAGGKKLGSTATVLGWSAGADAATGAATTGAGAGALGGMGEGRACA